MSDSAVKLTATSAELRGRFGSQQTDLTVKLSAEAFGKGARVASVFVYEPWTVADGGAAATVRRSGRGLSLDIPNVRQSAVKQAPVTLMARLESGATVLAQVRLPEVKVTISGEKAGLLQRRLKSVDQMLAALKRALSAEAGDRQAVKRYTTQVHALELEQRQVTRALEALQRAPQKDSFSWDAKPRYQF